LNLPTVIVWGSHDDDFAPAGAFAYLRDAPQAEVHILDTVHYATLERPDDVAEVVEGFLRRHSDLMAAPRNLGGSVATNRQ